MPGGIILIHAYLNEGFTGPRQAVDEYFGPRGIVPLPWPDRAGTAIVAKPLQ